MTGEAPVDVAYVEILPMFKGFNEKLKEQVSGPMAAAGRDIEKVNQDVGRSTEQIAKKSEGMFSGIKESIKGLVTTMIPLAAGFGLFEFIKGAIEVAGDAKKLNAQTAAAIASTGAAAHVTAKQISDYASELSAQTGITKDVIQNNENLLLTFTNIQNQVGAGNDIFNQATKAVNDMSVALKEDGKSASIQLGKALNDPIKGITALSRVGVAFTEKQKETIKSMVAHNNVLGAQKIILAELNKEFGGSANAQATAGAKLKAAYHEVEEEVGAKLLPVMGKISTFISTRVLPAFMQMFEQAGKGEGVFGSLKLIFNNLQTILRPLAETVVSFVKQGWAILGDVLMHNVTPALKDVAEWLGKHGTLVRSVAVGIVAAVAAVKAWAIVVRIAAAAQAVWNTVMALNPIGVIIVAVIALVAAFIYAYKHSKTFRDIVDEVGRTAARVGKDIYQFFINLYHVGVAVWHALDDAWHNINHAWMNTWTFLKNAWDNVVKFLEKWGPLALAVLAPFIGIPLLIYQHWNQISGLITKVWSGAYESTVRGVTGVLTWLGDIPNKIKTVFKGADRWLDNAGHEVITGFLDGMKNLWHLITDWFGKIPGILLGLIGIHSQPQWAIDAGVNTILGMLSGFKNTWHFITEWFSRILGWIATAIGNENAWASRVGTSLINGFRSGVAATWHVVTDFFAGVLGSIGRAIGAYNDWAYRVGTDIINALWHGVEAVWNDVMGWFGKIPGWIKNALGIHSPPAWAVDAGSWIMKGLIKGLIGGSFDLAHFIEHFASIARKKLASLFSSGGGAPANAGALIEWITQAEGLTGVGSSWTAPLLTLIGRESGGDPRSINLTDSNAKAGDPSRGLMQTIGATFERYRMTSLPDDIYNPVANIVAGIRYILARYGSIFNVQQADPTRPPLGYASGSWNIPSDQLAFLHKREMVIPAKAADRIRAGADITVSLSDDTIIKLGTVIAQQLSGVGRHTLRMARAT